MRSLCAPSRTTTRQAASRISAPRLCGRHGRHGSHLDPPSACAYPDCPDSQDWCHPSTSVRRHDDRAGPRRSSPRSTCRSTRGGRCLPPGMRTRASPRSSRSGSSGGRGSTSATPASSTEPGSFVTSRAGDVPVVVVARPRRRAARRSSTSAATAATSSATVRAGARRCSARTTPGRTISTARCGRRRAPRREPGFDRDGSASLPSRVDTWGPFVFVNPDPDAGPLAEHLGDLPRIVAERRRRRRRRSSSTRAPRASTTRTGRSASRTTSSATTARSRIRASRRRSTSTPARTRSRSTRRSRASSGRCATATLERANGPRRTCRTAT